MPVAFPRESELAAWKMFQFTWRLLGGAIGVVIVALVTSGFYINPAGYPTVFAIAVLFWHFGQKNIQSATRSDSRVSYCLIAMAQILVTVSILTTLTYLATSIGLPAWEATPLARDRALGLDFTSYLQFINDHPRVLVILAPSYPSVTWQMVALGVILPLSGNFRRSGRLILRKRSRSPTPQLSSLDRRMHRIPMI